MDPPVSRLAMRLECYRLLLRSEDVHWIVTNPVSVAYAPVRTTDRHSRYIPPTFIVRPGLGSPSSFGRLENGKVKGIGRPIVRTNPVGGSTYAVFDPKAITRVQYASTLAFGDANVPSPHALGQRGRSKLASAHCCQSFPINEVVSQAEQAGTPGLPAGRGTPGLPVNT